VLYAALLLAGSWAASGFELYQLTLGLARMMPTATGVLLLCWLLRVVLWAGHQDSPPVSKDQLPGVSVIVPCYNEGSNLVKTVRAIQENKYPARRIELLIVDDGSDDDSAEWAEHALAEGSTAGKLVRLSENKGKRGALAAGLDEARFGVVVTIDSDSRIGEKALHHLVSPLVENSRVGVVAGAVEPSCRSGLLSGPLKAAFAVSFDLERVVQSRFRRVFCAPGAISAYRRDAVKAVLPPWLKGRDAAPTRRVGEDRELTNRLLAAGWGSVYQSRAIAETDLPNTLTEICRMLLRWTRGDIRETWRYLRRIGFRSSRCLALAADGYLSLHVLERLLVYGAMAVAIIGAAQHPRSLMIIPAAVVVGAAPLCCWLVWQREVKKAVELPIYGLMWVTLLSWIGPWAIATFRSQKWLTRKAETNIVEEKAYFGSLGQPDWKGWLHWASDC